MKLAYFRRDVLDVLLRILVFESMGTSLVHGVPGWWYRSNKLVFYLQFNTHSATKLACRQHTHSQQNSTVIKPIGHWPTDKHVIRIWYINYSWADWMRETDLSTYKIICIEIRYHMNRLKLLHVLIRIHFRVASTHLYRVNKPYALFVPWTDTTTTKNSDWFNYIGYLNQSKKHTFQMKWN